MQRRRCILHADLNNFYASVECIFRPELKNVPMVVGGDVEARHGIVLAKNGLAKACGVQTAEVLWEAKRKCANLVVVPPHPEKYLAFSRQIRSIYSDYTDRIEPFGMDEAWLDVTGDEKTGQEIADELRARAKEEVGLTLSVGVAENKIFAKLGSDMKKPDATTVITHENFREKVWPLSAHELLYIGAATRSKLSARNILTIGDIARADRGVLCDILGKGGDMAWMYANGYDATPVALTLSEGEVKSIGNSTTLPRDVFSAGESKMTVYILAECIAERMREAGLMGKVIHVYLRDDKLSGITRQRKLKCATDISAEIAAHAMSLLETEYAWARPIRTLGVSVSALELTNGDKQLSFLDETKRERTRALDVTVGDIRRRFGHFAIQRGVMLSDLDVSRINPKDGHEAQPFAHMRNGGGPGAMMSAV